MCNRKMEEYICIFRPYITCKDGTRIYARQYGKKAFRIVVSKKDD